MTAEEAGGNVCLYIEFPKLKSFHLRPWEEAVELRHKVLLVVPVDETFPAVVYEPTGNVGPKDAVCPVVFLEASAGERDMGSEGTEQGSSLHVSKGDTPLLLFAPLLASSLPPNSGSPIHSKYQSRETWCYEDRISGVSLHNSRTLSRDRPIWLLPGT